MTATFAPAGAVGAIAAAAAALSPLRDLDRLLARAPHALVRLGFERAWVSTIDGPQWRLAGGAERRACFPDMPPGPHPLRLSSHEASAVRLRKRVAVLHARGDVAVDPVIARELAPSAYVVAPIQIESRAVGLVHADPGGAELDRDSVAVVVLFTAVLAEIAQRIALETRLNRLRLDLRAMTGALTSAVDESCGLPLDLSIAPAPPPPHAQAIGSLRGSAELASLLTPRQLEVLRMMASGYSNVEISAQLVLSEGTVKSHVKQILRRLRATNRAQAVARAMSILGAGNADDVRLSDWSRYAA